MRCSRRQGRSNRPSCAPFIAEGSSPLANIQQCLRITGAIRIPQDVVVAHLFACARQSPIHEPHQRVRPEANHGDPLDHGHQHVAPQDVGAFVHQRIAKTIRGKAAEDGRREHNQRAKGSYRDRVPDSRRGTPRCVARGFS